LIKKLTIKTFFIVVDVVIVSFFPTERRRSNSRGNMRGRKRTRISRKIAKKIMNIRRRRRKKKELFP
jgi:hypothetical protein